jgi:hypothetical protein
MEFMELGIFCQILQVHSTGYKEPPTITETEPEAIEDFTIPYEGVSKSFRTGPVERELQMVQLSATRRSCIAIL